MAKLPDISGAVTLDDQLREVARWPERIAYAIRRARRQLSDERKAANDTQILRTLGYLTDACRIAGEHDAAIEYGQEALDRARASANRNAEVANLLRLGAAYQYRGDHARAEPLFREAITISSSDEAHALYDTALYHLGVFLLEQGQYDESITCLEQALDLRRPRGIEPQIEVTERALTLAKIGKAASGS